MNEILKYKSIGEMAERSRTGGANYVRLEDYDNLKATYDNIIFEMELLRAQAENDSEANSAIRYERDHYLSQRDNACNAYTKSQINLSKAAELSLKAEARIEELEAEIDKLKRDVKDIEREYLNSDACFNAVVDYMLNKGYMESPLEFLRCWNEGNFEALREEWPDAPEEIYFADPLYKGKV